jgi:hypothetical protein
MTARIVLLALVISATPAMAFDTTKLGQGGTLMLDEIMPLIGKAPALRGEVIQALAERKKRADEIICSGYRFPREWVHLGGARVSPYACDFGGKWLEIKATVRVAGRSRQVYDTITPGAMMNAVRVAETDPIWTWSNEPPPEKP